MNDVPAAAIDWWIGISIAFFVINILVFLGLFVFLMMLMKMMRDLKPKVESLTTKVEGISKNVEEITQHVKVTAETVGDRTQHVAASVDTIAHAAANAFERFSPYIMGALTAMRLVGGFMEMRRKISPEKALAEARRKKIKKALAA